MPRTTTFANISARAFGFGGSSVKWMVATGGTITTDGDYKVHTFTGSSTFTVTQLGDVGTVEYLVIAGGSGGAGINWSGGGGAGGYRTATGFGVTETGYSITVGGSGAVGASYNRGTSGANSVFSSITSTGGGDADYQNAADSLMISWSGSDEVSGISTYEYALGTTSGETDIVDWATNGTATADTVSNLSLSDGQIYYLMQI